MAKEKFEDRRLTGTLRVKLERDDHDCGKYWEADKKAVVDSIIQVIGDYSRKGYKLTLRQVYYQLVAKNVIPNDNIAYKKLSSLLDDCRYSGKIDWDDIEDRGRVPYTPYYEESITGALERAIDYYNLDKRTDQPIYLEVWTEKDAVSNIIKDAVRDYTLTIGINKGFASSTAIYNAYNRFVSKVLRRQKVILLYCGDFDPSGLDMVRDITDRLEFMMSNGKLQQRILDLYDSDRLGDLFKKHEDLMIRFVENTKKANRSVKDKEELRSLAARVVVREYFSVESVCLTQNQIRMFNLPPNPAKLSDPRAKKYVQEYGDISWELDALNPSDLKDILREKVSEYVDETILENVKEKESKDIDKLRSFIRKLND